MDSFHKCFYDVSTCNNGVVLSRKLPPDKVKVKLLATTAYLMTLIMCILIPATSYNGVPAVLRTSSDGVIPEEMSTCDTFHSYTMSPSCHHHFPFKPWTSGLDLMYPPSRPSLTWMITPVENDQMIPNCIQSSQFSQDVRPSSRCRSSLTDEEHHRFYYLYSIVHYFRLRMLKARDSGLFWGLVIGLL